MYALQGVRGVCTNLHPEQKKKSANLQEFHLRYAPDRFFFFFLKVAKATSCGRGAPPPPPSDTLARALRALKWWTSEIGERPSGPQ